MVQSTEQHIWWVLLQSGVGDAILTQDVLRRCGSINAPIDVTTLAISQTGETGSRFHIIPSVFTCRLCPEFNTVTHVMTGVVPQRALPPGNLGLLVRGGSGRWCKSAKNLGRLRLASCLQRAISLLVRRTSRNWLWHYRLRGRGGVALLIPELWWAVGLLILLVLV